MSNVTFSGFEGLIQISGATVAVAEEFNITLKQELEEVRAIGDFKPQDQKEVFQTVEWTLRRAYFVDATAADFFTRAIRDANGYLPSFSMTIRFRDLSTGAPVDRTYTLGGCKVAKYGNETRAGRGLVMESLEGPANTMTRA